MKYISALTLLFLLILFSCNSTNKSVSTTSGSETQVMSKKMIEDGFTNGTITISKKEGDCPITIKVVGKDGSYYLDPINLSSDFQKEGKKVWFKYGGLRMMNRCDKASPISIIEIQKQ
ncbi:MAG: hypothetical protein QM499_06845 [Flavobacteriaceae bacterium]